MRRISIIIVATLLVIRCTNEKIESVNNPNLISVDSNKTSLNYKIKLDSNANISIIDNKDGTCEKGVFVDNKRNGVWKKYNPDKTIESVAYYYNDSLFYVLDKSDYSFIDYKINNEAKISYPKNWSIIKGQQGALVSFLKKADKNDNAFMPLINIQMDALDEKENFSDYVSNEMEALKSNSTFKLIKIKEYGINHLNTIQAIYIIIVKDIKLGVVTNWVNKGGKVYILTAMVSNERKGDFIKYKELFQDILFTFEIND